MARRKPEEFPVNTPKIAQLYATYGLRKPFYADEVLMSEAELNRLVETGFAVRGERGRGYIFTRNVQQLIERGQQYDRGARDLRELIVDERPRGFSRGSRRIPWAPDSDGNRRDPKR